MFSQLFGVAIFFFITVFPIICIVRAIVQKIKEKRKEKQS